MFTRVHEVINQKIQFYTAFYAGAQYVTVRTFEEDTSTFDPQATVLDAEATDAYLKSHESRLMFMGDYLVRPVLIDGSGFGKPGTKFKLIDRVRVERDKELFGAGVLSDGCTLMVCADDAGNIKTPFNRTALTMHERENKYAMYHQMRVTSLLTLSMDFAEDSFLDAQVFFKHGVDRGVVHFDETAIGTFPQVWHPGQRPVYDEPPSIKIVSHQASVTPNGVVTYTVEVRKTETSALLLKRCTLYLEAVSGYLPKTRVDITDGVGTFQAMALGLSEGDALRVKVGFRYMPGIADCTVIVKS